MNADNSKPAHCKKYIWGMLNIEASIWLENILVYLSLICSSKLTVFAFVRFSEQTMFADKHATMKAIFYWLIGCKRLSMDTILLIWFKKKKTVKKKNSRLNKQTSIMSHGLSRASKEIANRGGRVRIEHEAK